MVPIAQRLLGGGCGVHVSQVLHTAAGRTASDNVEKGQNAGLRAVDHPPFEIRKGAPPGAAGFPNGGNAGRERERIGKHRHVVGGAGAVGTGVTVKMKIEQARRDIQAGDINDLERRGCRDVRPDRDDPAILNRDVPNVVDLIPAVDYMARFQQQVI